MNRVDKSGQASTRITHFVVSSLQKALIIYLPNVLWLSGKTGAPSWNSEDIAPFTGLSPFALGLLGILKLLAILYP